MQGPLHTQKPKWVPPRWFIPFVFLAGGGWIFVEVMFGNLLFALAAGVLLSLAGYEVWKNKRASKEKGTADSGSISSE